jgi:hypothetical protein
MDDGQGIGCTLVDGTLDVSSQHGAGSVAVKQAILNDGSSS